MKFTIKIPGLTLYPGTARHWWEDATGDDIRRAAQRAEELGYEYFTVSEHIVLNDEWLTQMGSRWVHSQSASGVLLGATTKPKIICLLVIPYHNPITLAKSIATLDFLSGGRIIVQALVGYNKWEFDVLGVPIETRGARTNEYLEAMRELWTNDSPTYEGEFVHISPDFIMDPKPTGHVPIWMGGGTKATMRRVARIGDGWMSSFPYVSRQDFKGMLEYMYEQPEYQRNPRPMEFGLRLFEGERDSYTHEVIKQAEVRLEKDYILEQVAEIASIGATITDANEVLGLGQYQNDDPNAPPPTNSLEEWLERIEWFAEEILPEASRIESMTFSDS